MESQLKNLISNHSKKRQMQAVRWRVKAEKRALLSIHTETRSDKSRFKLLYHLHQESKSTNSWKALRVSKLSSVAQLWLQEDPLSCQSLMTREIQRTPYLKSGQFQTKITSAQATASLSNRMQLNYQSNLPKEPQAQNELKVLAIEVLRALKNGLSSEKLR